MGRSGPKRGYTYPATSVVESEVVDACMRNESAVDVSRRAITDRLRQEAGDTLGQALVDSGSLASQRKCADKIVIWILLGKAYGDLIRRHERAVEMVTGFVLWTARQNPTQMIDIEILSHGVSAGVPVSEAQSTRTCSRADQRKAVRRRESLRNLHSARRKHPPQSGFVFLQVDFPKRNS